MPSQDPYSYSRASQRHRYENEVTSYCNSIKTEYTNYKAEIGK